MASSLFLLLGALGARTAHSQEIFWNFRGAFAPSSDVRCPQNQYQTVKHERGQDNEFKVYATPDSCQELFTAPAGRATRAGNGGDPGRGRVVPSPRRPRRSRRYYSPAGAAYADDLRDADDFFKTVWYNGTQSKCSTMQGFAPNIYFYACECNFGFLCLPNTALPAFCPEGFYCTYPWDYDECQEGASAGVLFLPARTPGNANAAAGHYCKEGSVYGTPCTAMEACPKGSPVPMVSSSGPTLFLAFVGMFFIIFKIQERQIEMKMSKENQEMEDYLAACKTAEDNKMPEEPEAILIEYVDAAGVGGWGRLAAGDGSGGETKDEAGGGGIEMRQETPPSVAPKEVELDTAPPPEGADHVMEFVVEFETLTRVAPRPKPPRPETAAPRNRPCSPTRPAAWPPSAGASAGASCSGA